MANIELLLEEGGAELEDICKIVVYLTDIRHREAVYRVLGSGWRACSRCSPASSSRRWRGPSGWSRST